MANTSIGYFDVHFFLKFLNPIGYFGIFLTFSNTACHETAAQSHPMPGGLPWKYLETTRILLDFMSQCQLTFNLKHNSIS